MCQGYGIQGLKREKQILELLVKCELTLTPKDLNWKTSCYTVIILMFALFSLFFIFLTP